MFGLRSKILFGFGGLLLILLASGLLAETVISRYSETMRRSFKEDYGSALFCQRMKTSVEQIDVLVKKSFRDPGAAAPELTLIRGEFDRDLVNQRGEATLDGEKEATDELAGLWSRYQALLPEVIDPATDLARRQAAFETDLYPQSLAVRGAAQKIIDMNMKSMLSVHSKVVDMGARATLAVRTLMLSAGALAIIFAALIGRFILRPVRLLTQTVQEIERGNLELAVPFRSSDELGTLAVAVTDMAAQLRAYRRSDRERLLRTERTTQLAIDSLPDAVVVVTPAGVVELANNAAKRLFGLAPGVDVKALPAEAGGSAPWLADLHRRILATGHASELSGYESTIEVRDDGSQRFFLPRTVPILDESRRPIGATIVLADVTGLRRLDETKNNLLSLVSHELKTPLTSNRMILHLVAGLKVGPLTPRQQELLTTARDDADRLTRIIENLLDMSRIESGKALMELRPVDPGQLVEQGVESLQPAFVSQNVAIRVSMPNPLPMVSADATRIGHVFANLLNNSLRHTPAGGHVDIEARADGSFVEFSVADDGMGIPRQYAHRIFEKFFRVPGQTGASGSGLGLALSKDIVEAHGGQIRAEPADDHGTIVRFTLRRADTAAQATGEPAPAVA
jgi:PAS domain S-box-containing protein